MVKQDGETNIADIGTKSLAGPRFKWLRDQLGRVKVRDTSAVPEAKAERVNLVTAKTDMHKVGCAVMVLMECITRPMAKVSAPAGRHRLSATRRATTDRATSTASSLA